MVARALVERHQVTRDVDYGKKLAEQMIMESFVGSFRRVTGRRVEDVVQGESPTEMAGFYECERTRKPFG